MEQVFISREGDASCKVDSVDLLQGTCICSSTQVKSKVKFSHRIHNLLEGEKNWIHPLFQSLQWQWLAHLLYNASQVMMQITLLLETSLSQMSRVTYSGRSFHSVLQPWVYNVLFWSTLQDHQSHNTLFWASLAPWYHLNHSLLLHIFPRKPSQWFIKTQILHL